MSGGPLVRFGRGVLDHPWYIVLAIVSVALVYWTIGTRTQDHKVRASFSSAFNLAPGLDVQVNGQDIGKLGKVSYEDGHAVVELGIDDEDYWPLHEGTTAVSRFGTTIGSGTRYVELNPGPDTGREIPEDGIIEMKNTTPVNDVDEILNVFTKERRGNVQTLSASMRKAIKGSDLNDALRTAGPGVTAASNFLQSLGSDSAALRGLIRNTRKTMGTLSSRSGTVSDLVTVTAATFDEFAQNTQSMEQALVESPSTFREARTTLSRLDSSVDKLDKLVVDLRPGARQLTPLARAATPTLRELRRTVPIAVDTVRTVTKASRPLNNLLTAGTPLMERLGGSAEGLAPQVACIRPYAPETAGAITGLSGWTQQSQVLSNQTEYERAQNLPTRHRGPSPGENRHIAKNLRAQPIVSARSFHSFPSEISSEAFAKLTGISYAYPRPPGLTAGQPWFQPECGVGPESLDPATDPENG